MEIESFIQRRYKPIKARNTPNHILKLHFLLKNNPMIGTIRIQHVVKNPAFPTEVPQYIPSCWAVLAKARANPQSVPPIISNLVFF